jgi:hypothetical protein
MLGWNDGTNEDGAGGGYASGDFYDQSQEQTGSGEIGIDNQEWADAMVSDREDDSRRR